MAKLSFKVKKPEKDIRPLCVISDLIYFFEEDLDMEFVYDNFIVDHFLDHLCFSQGKKIRKIFKMDSPTSSRACPFIGTRPNNQCENCAVSAFLGTKHFARWKKIDGRDMLGLFKGRIDLVEQACGGFDRFNIDDRCASVPTSGRLKFTGELYPIQEELIEMLLQDDYGLGIAPPRTGKTVVLIWLACHLKCRVLIVAHQQDLLQQFYDTFVGSEEQEALTNAPELMAQGLEPVKIATCIDDHFGDHDVVLTTYQQFIRDGTGPRRLEIIQGMYEMWGVDEIHRGNADAYANVLSYSDARKCYGFTATNERKDGLEFVVEYTVGPVLGEVKPETLIPTIYASETNMGCSSARGMVDVNAAWNHVLKKITKSKRWKKKLAKRVVDDILDGFRIVIPSERVSFCLEMCSEINDAWYEATGDKEPVAKPFMGALNEIQRKKVLDAARSEDIGCVVAMRKMLLGINVPAWSLMYEVFPINNKSNFKQESARICTPWKDKEGNSLKNDPEIRFLLDLGSESTCKWYSNTCAQSKKFDYHLTEQALDLWDKAERRLMTKDFLDSDTLMEDF